MIAVGLMMVAVVLVVRMIAVLLRLMPALFLVFVRAMFFGLLMQLRTPRNLKTTEFKADIMQSEEDTHLNGVMRREANLQKMEDCLQTLSPDQKITVEMFYLQNKCYKEITEATGIEWNKVRSHIQNGRRNLKICMEKNEEATVIPITKTS